VLNRKYLDKDGSLSQQYGCECHIVKDAWITQTANVADVTPLPGILHHHMGILRGVSPCCNWAELL